MGYMEQNRITSSSNCKLKELRQLQKKSRLRQEKALFLAEGFRIVRETPKDRILAAYVSESFRKEQGDWLEQWQVPYDSVEDGLFQSVCDTKTPQGILCLVKRREWTLEQMLSRETEGGESEDRPGGIHRAPLFLVIENLQDPGNLGTIFRTGEAAGVTGILMSRDTVDIYNPKTVRSTMGAIFRVPFLYTDSLAEGIDRLKKAQVQVFAAHLQGKQSYSRFSYEGGTAFLIGNEGNGLTRETAQLADRYLKIPMEGQAESLNAAVAAAVLLYEAHRQRHPEL
jgi:TrmH family RNA methyltransferase